MPRKDLSGKRFGRLTVIDFHHSDGHFAFWRCLCDCGNEKIVRGHHLVQGTVKSCGCLSDEARRCESKRQKCRERALKHGGFGTKLYGVWAAMIRRCENPHTPHYKDYGGRGIKVCSDWRNDFAVFRDWSLSNGYHDGLTIDRINVNGNYEPSNCRWVPISEQGLNRRSAIRVNFEGKEYTLGQLIKKFNLKSSTTYLWYHKGIPFEEILRRSK